jgi:hypothetical protein
MSHSVDDPVWTGLERRLAAVEAWVGEPAPWRPSEAGAPLAAGRVVRGSAFNGAKTDRSRGGRQPVALLVLLVLAAILAALVVVGVAGRPAPRPALVRGFNTLGVVAPSGSFDPGSTLWVRPTVVALPDGRALIMGYTFAGQTSYSAGLYDPASATFTSVGSAPTMLTNWIDYRATGLLDGRVLVTSGSDTSAALFDPATGAFAPTGSLSRSRFNAATALLHDGRVLVVGGEDMPQNHAADSSAEVFDPATGRFTLTGSLSVAQPVDTATTLADGRVLVTTGDAGQAELYDPSTGTFTPTGTMTTPRGGYAVSILADGRVLVVGGLVSNDNVSTNEVLGSAEVYDPATGRFSGVGSLVVPRAGASATLLLDGRVLVTGGGNVADTATELSSELYDPSTMRFSEVPGSLVPFGKGGTVATRLTDGDVLIVVSTGEVELFHP